MAAATIHVEQADHRPATSSPGRRVLRNSGTGRRRGPWCRTRRTGLPVEGRCVAGRVTVPVWRLVIRPATWPDGVVRCRRGSVRRRASSEELRVAVGKIAQRRRGRAPSSLQGPPASTRSVALTTGCDPLVGGAGHLGQPFVVAVVVEDRQPRCRSCRRSTPRCTASPGRSTWAGASCGCARTAWHGSSSPDRRAPRGTTDGRPATSSVPGAPRLDASREAGPRGL